MKDVSWADPPYSSHADYTELCEQSKPSDFFFYVKEDLEPTFGCSIIYLVPILYFEKEKYEWDQSMFLYHILPEDFGEDMESVWSCERPLAEVQQDMLDRGFKESAEFNALIDQNYD